MSEKDSKTSYVSGDRGMRRRPAPRLADHEGVPDDAPNNSRAPNVGHLDSSTASGDSDGSSKAKLVTFFRNGDPFFGGLSIPVTTKYCATFSSLLSWLNDKIPTTSGVRFIFNLISGEKVNGISELRPGDAYVVSSVNRLVPDVVYGEGKSRNRWNLKRVSAGRIRRNEIGLFANRPAGEKGNKISISGTLNSLSESTPPNPLPPNRSNFSNRMYSKQRPFVNGNMSKSRSPQPNQFSTSPSNFSNSSISQLPSMSGPKMGPSTRRNPGRTMNIVSNTHRYSREKVLLNRYTTQPFEDMLHDFTDMLLLDYPPIQTLYTFEPPFERVWSFSQLHNEFKYHDTFFACGRELRPLELNPENPDEADPLKHGLSSSAPDASPAPVTHRSNGRISMNSYPRSNWRNKDNRFDNYPLTRSRSVERFESPNHDFPNSQPTERPMQIRVRGAVHSIWPPTFNGEVSSESKSPSKTLQEDWMYGINSSALPQSLTMLKTGELVYSVGKIVVLYNSRDERQRYYLDHTSNVTCCCAHPTESQVASGQTSNGKSPPCVKVWDVRQLRTLITVFDNHFQDTIWSVEFSIESHGKYLLVLDGDSNKRRQGLYLFSWRERTLLARTKTSSDNVLAAHFHVDDDTTLLTHGKQHINFWRIFWAGQAGENTRILRDKKSGHFMDSVPSSIYCVAFDLVGNVVTGDSDGCIRVWTLDDDDAFVCRPVQHLQNAHRDSITSIIVLGDGTLLSGSLSSIAAWDTLNDYMFVREVKVERSWGQVVRICPKSHRSLDGQLIIGCSGSVIAEGSVHDGFRVLARGHTGRCIYTASHPREHSFVSAGDDQRLIKWSLLQHTPTWTANVEHPCTAVTYHPEGHLIVLGTEVGRFIVYDNQSGTHVMSFQLGTESILTIKYSPDIHFIAFGCRDGIIHVFVVDRDGLILRRREGPLKAHHSSLNFIDWDQQSSKLRTQALDGSQKAWDVTRMKQIEDYEVRDVKFNTADCFISYQVKGLWLRNSDKKSSCAVASRSFCEDHYGVGTPGGKIQLFGYPILNDKDRCVQKDLHNGCIKSVKFSFDDNYLLSSDESTSPCIIQWSLIVKRI